MRSTNRLLLLVTLALGMPAACSDLAGEDDAADDSFADGKADAYGVSEGSPEALGVLALVNSVRYRELKEGAGVSPTAAWNIVMHRAGPDELDGTADDDPFDTLVELDRIPYVGPVTFGKLVAYARERGLVAATIVEGAEALEALFPGGRGAGLVPVTSHEPLAMIREYVEERHGEDVLDFEFVTDSAELLGDERVAGTVQLEAVREAAEQGLEWVWEPAELDAKAAALRALIDGLVARGAVFGFDGWEQNGCAAPTTLLLVLDPAAPLVYAIDLNPCDE